MASATETTVSAILKEVYPGEIEDQLNNEVALWAILADTKEDVTGQGKHLIRPLRTQRSQGIGSVADNGTLPGAGSQTYVDTTINMASTYFVGQISGRTMRTANGSDAAFDNALSAEMRFGMSDFVTDVGRQLMTGAGVITNVNGAVTASTTVVVKDVTNLQVGMLVQFWLAGANQTTNDSGVVGTAIVSITPSTQTIVVTTVQTITTLAGVSRAGNNAAINTSNEMEGLETIVDDLTDFAGRNYFGLSRTTNTILKGNRLDMSNGSAGPNDATTIMNENKLQWLTDQCRQIGGAFSNLIITDYNTRRKYANLLQANKRFPVQGSTAPVFAGGFERSKDLRANLNEGLTFDSMPIIASRQCLAGHGFILDTSALKLFQQSDLEWVPNGDSILHPLLVNNQDAYKYSFYYDSAFYCEAPNRQAKFVNA